MRGRVEGLGAEFVVHIWLSGSAARRNFLRMTNDPDQSRNGREQRDRQSQAPSFINVESVCVRSSGNSR